MGRSCFGRICPAGARKGGDTKEATDATASPSCAGSVACGRWRAESVQLSVTEAQIGKLVAFGRRGKPRLRVMGDDSQGSEGPGAG